MGYSCYTRGDRDQGYGVPAECDHPDCHAQIDRGIAYACGGDPDATCGLFFCANHLWLPELEGPQMCERCVRGEDEPFDPKPDVPEWINHKLTHPSWQQWRDENPDDVARMEAS